MTSYTTNVLLAGVAALLLAGCTAISTDGTGSTLTTTSSGATLGSSTTTTTTTSGFSSSASGFSSGSAGFGSGFAQNASAQSASLGQPQGLQGMDTLLPHEDGFEPFSALELYSRRSVTSELK